MPERLQGFLPRPLSSACRWPFTHGRLLWLLVASLCACLCPTCLLKGHPSDQGPSVLPHFTLITCLEALSPNTVTFGGAVLLRLQHMNLGLGDTIQPVTDGDLFHVAIHVTVVPTFTAAHLFSVHIHTSVMEPSSSPGLLRLPSPHPLRRRWQ